jgi:hypothetical protein
LQGATGATASGGLFGRIPPLSRIFTANHSLAKWNSAAIAGLYDFAPNDFA